VSIKEDQVQGKKIEQSHNAMQIEGNFERPSPDKKGRNDEERIPKALLSIVKAEKQSGDWLGEGVNKTTKAPDCINTEIRG